METFGVVYQRAGHKKSINRMFEYIYYYEVITEGHIFIPKGISVFVLILFLSLRHSDSRRESMNYAAAAMKGDHLVY